MDPSRTSRDGTAFVTVPEAAEKLSVPVGTIYSWVSRGELAPVAVAPGGVSLYRLSEIENRVRNTKRRRGPRHA